MVIEELTLLDAGDHWLDLEVRCGKGTYIRALARDIGRRLGTRGHLSALRRTASAGFHVRDALTVEQFVSLCSAKRGSEAVLDLAAALPLLPKRVLSAHSEELIAHGQALPMDAVPDEHSLGDGDLLCLLNQGGELCAVAKIEECRVRPLRVFLAR